MGRRRRDPVQLDVFRMKPRGRRGPKVVAYRDKHGKFIEIMKLDKDVNLRTRRKRRVSK